MFTPTDEQLACIEAARSTQDNLLIEALAGAAKTTTLELIGKALPSIPILYIVFNKRNADEAAKRLPGHITARTMNALGHRTWASALGRKQIVVDGSKTHTIYKSLHADLKGPARRESFDDMSDTIALVRAAKRVGYIPDTYHIGKSLCTLDELIDSIETDPAPSVIDRFHRVLTFSLDEAFAGRIDFDDQIYMPVVFGGTWPTFPLVMVDEAQDLSPLNHEMLRQLARKRLIAVGDPYQSIYGFRGAVANGMNVLAETFSMTRLSLSTSFRCPRAVVIAARRRAPHMQFASWAPEGSVTSKQEWSLADIPESNVAIICRNNAPLFKLGMELIRAQRNIKLLGADIGPGLIRVLKKLGDPSLSRESVLTAIAKWEETELRKSKKKASIADRAACLRVFAAEAPTLSGAIAFAEHLFAAEGPIQLMSGHKSKGLEFDTVFHLDPWRIPSLYAESDEDILQEQNIEYVILTRAKLNYVEVSLRGLKEMAPAE